MCGGAVATGRRSKNYHTLPHFETEAQHVVSSFCCLLPTADCGLPTLSAASWLCLREKDTCPGQRDGCWLLVAARSRRHSTCICIFKLRFVCGLPLGTVYTRIADRRGCASLSTPIPSPSLFLLHSATLSLSFAALFIHLALNSYASQRFCR